MPLADTMVRIVLHRPLVGIFTTGGVMGVPVASTSAGPALVVLTMGGHGALALTTADRISVSAPRRP